jgi:hypothetical protein
MSMILEQKAAAKAKDLAAELASARIDYPRLIREENPTPEHGRRLDVVQAILKLSDDAVKEHQRELAKVRRWEAQLEPEAKSRELDAKWEDSCTKAVPLLVRIASDTIGRAMAKYGPEDVEKAKQYVAILIHQCSGALTEDEKSDLSLRFRTAIEFLNGTDPAKRDTEQQSLRRAIESAKRDKLVFPEEQAASSGN